MGRTDLAPLILDEIRLQARYATREIQLEFPVRGRVVDVSESGIGLESPQKLIVGARFHFRVRNRSKSLCLPGRVEWCRLTGTRTGDGGEIVPVFRSGVAIDDCLSRRAWQGALRQITLMLQARRAQLQAPAAGAVAPGLAGAEAQA